TEPPGDERPVHVVIDCGVVGGTPDATVRMKQIVQDIREKTRNHLDLLVVTHEHWDHVSGFVQAADEWAHIDVDKLWMAWTEADDPVDLPEVLQKVLSKQRLTMAAVADRAVANDLSGGFDTVRGLMAFQADAPAVGEGFAAAPGVADAFQAAKERVKDANDRT